MPYPSFSKILPLSALIFIATAGLPKARVHKEKLSLSIRAYGARGNGVRDDTAAIAATIAALPPTGGIVLIPSGTYLISAGATIPAHTTVHCRGATIVAAPSISWSHGVNSVFTSSATGITIEGCKFLFPYGNENYGGGAAHILEFTGSRVDVLNNISDGGGDFVAAIGVRSITSRANIVTNISNSCFDHWGGSINVRVIDNRCSTYRGAGGGLGAVQFTGLNTDLTPASTTGLIATDNVIEINNGNAPQAFEINGPTSGGSSSHIEISRNRIYVNRASAWGVLLTGIVTDAVITGNYFQGSLGPYAAVGVASSASRITIRGNVACDWHAGGVFVSRAVRGVLSNNRIQCLYH